MISSSKNAVMHQPRIPKMNMLTDPTWLQVHYGCTGKEKASWVSFFSNQTGG